MLNRSLFQSQGDSPKTIILALFTDLFVYSASVLFNGILEKNKTMAYWLVGSWGEDYFKMKANKKVEH